MATSNETSQAAVELYRAGKDFAGRTALEETSLTVRSGEVVGVLGPNGAGKSTLISLVAGLRLPSRGRVRVLGGDPRHPAVRMSIGSTPQQTGLPENIRVHEVIGFAAVHYPDPESTGELLERFGLEGLADRRCGALSGGQQRRLAVALAMVGRPRLMLLDEPTTGLDLQARHALWDAVDAYAAQGGTVLVTSHYLEEIQRLAGRVVVIDRGRVLADDSTSAVIDRVDVDRISLISRDPRLESLPGLASLERDGDHVTLLAADGDVLVRRLVDEGIDFRELRVSGATLEDAFAQLTAHAA